MNIRYNDSSQEILFKFPQNWIDERASITSVNIQISDQSGNSLLTSTAMTLPAATTTDGAVTSGSHQVTLDAAVTLNRDYLIIDDSIEQIHIDDYDETSKIATLSDNLYHDYADQSNVYPLFATYDLDTSDTDTFESGLELVITFVNNLGSTFRDIGRILEQEYSVSGFQREFQILYPNEYRLVQDSFNEFAELSDRRLRSRLRSKNIDIDKCYEKDLFDPLFSSYMRMIILERGGDTSSYEYEMASKSYEQLELQALSTASWIDHDQDQVEDTNEFTRRLPVFFGRGF